MTSRIDRIKAAALDLARDRALTAHSLAERILVSRDRARRWIRLLRDEGLIEEIGKEPAPKMGPPRKVWGLR